MNGIVYLAVHYRNCQGGPGNSTAFYKLNALNLDIVKLNLNASSNAVVLASLAEVPEPAAWAMMLGDFGFLGAVARRRQRATLTFA